MIGTLSLNFEIVENCDCYTLSIQDTSHYPVTPESPILDITVPGFNRVRFEFQLNKINVFNSYSLRLTNSNTNDTVIELPDGLYEFTYAVCPYESLYVDKYHLRTCLLESRLAKYWAKVVTTCDTQSKIFKDIDKIEILLKGAKANAQICNTKKAVELYKLANELLTKLEGTNNCCNC